MTQSSILNQSQVRSRPVLAVVLGSITWATWSTAAGQTYPAAADVTTLDGIINAYYEVVSGPAGQPRQWARDRSLHHPEAQVFIVGNAPDGTPLGQVMTLADYHERSGGLAERGFFEYEINREIQRHGAIAHVWSTYEWRTAREGPIGGRGSTVSTSITTAIAGGSPRGCSTGGAMRHPYPMNTCPATRNPERSSEEFSSQGFWHRHHFH